jgi:DNA-binding transcriptional LysR family regulator
MTFEPLRIFLAVAEHLHFTRAAEILDAFPYLFLIYLL